VREPGASWTDALIAALDDTVALVASPVCHWTDGSLIDLERLAPAVRAVGAALVVDASQAAGAHPIDVSRIQPDFLCAVGYKWLLGPYSLGYLYVDPKWHERGVPIEQTWMSRAGAEDFTSLVDYVDELRPGRAAVRHGRSSRSSPCCRCRSPRSPRCSNGACRASPPASARSRPASPLRSAALGCEVPPDSGRVAHIVGVKLPRGLPSGLTERLARPRVFVSVRGDSIRVAPHLYNDARDVERFVGVLRSIL
jgi:selenocysteine lyase/cysteine desulfurase